MPNNNRGRILITQEYLMDMITSNEGFRRDFIDPLPESARFLHVNKCPKGGVFYMDAICDLFAEVVDDEVPVMNIGLELKKEYLKEDDDAKDQ